jgi:TonB family protein
VFDPGRREAEEEGARSPSILGLSGIRPLSAGVAPGPRSVAPGGEAVPLSEPPGTSLLGLGSVRAMPGAFQSSPGAVDPEPPTRSLLGLEGLPFAFEPLRIPPSTGENGGPPNPTLLGLENVPYAPYTATPRPPPVPRPAAPPAAVPRASPGPSFFGIQTRMPLPGSAAPLAPPREVEVPDFERDVEHRVERAFPIERAILVSIAAHVLLILLLSFAPVSVLSNPHKALLAAFAPPDKSAEEKIPIVFREAPGPARENPKKAELSDADRRAGGGDRSKPKSSAPFVPERRGIQGLAPGAPLVRRPLQRPSAAEAERQARAQPPAASSPREDGIKNEGSPDAFRLPPAGPSREGAAGAKALPDLRTAAKEAARQVVASGGGEAGAGFPNPDGGFVDTGPLSFETSWYDWGPYAAEMVRRIKLHWKTPNDPFKGKVTIRFAILPDGHVADVQILKESQNPAYTHAAEQAIVTSDPFRPLPKDLLESLGKEHREHIIVTFFYNYRPEEIGKPGEPY